MDKFPDGFRETVLVRRRERVDMDEQHRYVYDTNELRRYIYNKILDATGKLVAISLETERVYMGLSRVQVTRELTEMNFVVYARQKSLWSDTDRFDKCPYTSAKTIAVLLDPKDEEAEYESISLERAEFLQTLS